MPCPVATGFSSGGTSESSDCKGSAILSDPVLFTDVDDMLVERLRPREGDGMLSIVVIVFTW